MLKFPAPDETVEDISEEMRSVPRKDECLYELHKIEPGMDKMAMYVIDRRKMTLAKLADRLDAAIKRRQDEASRLWKALEMMRDYCNRLNLVGNRDSLFEYVLAANNLKRKEGGEP